MNNSFEFILNNLIRGTPYWVWLVLVYILFIGIRATKPRRESLYKLFVLPFILMATKYQIFIDGSYYVWSYIVPFLIGIALGYWFAEREMVRIIKTTRAVELQGSYQKLTLLIIFFIARYSFGYLRASNSIIGAKYLSLEIYIIALLPGYFLGKALNYLIRYYVRNQT